MILIIGGAYQGKFEYVREKYNFNKVFECQENSKEIDFSADVIIGFHNFVFSQVKEEIDSIKFIEENLEILRDKIIICDDISSGVVPLSFETRTWREMVGRCLVLLSKNSEEVVRVFCGIGTRIK